MSQGFFHLPFEIQRYIMILSSASEIYKFCQLNNRLNNLCQSKHFWADKMIYNYPQYTGQLLNNSYQETFWKLTRNRQVTVYYIFDKRISPIKLTALTTFDDIIHEINKKYGFSISVLLSNPSDETIIEPAVFYISLIKNTPYISIDNHERKWHIKILRNTPIYAIQLIGNKNFFLDVNMIEA